MRLFLRGVREVLNVGAVFGGQKVGYVGCLLSPAKEVNLGQNRIAADS